MLVTREVDYAFRIVRCLSDGKRHSMTEICEDQIIPQQFAYKIIKKLSDAGVIKSIRGVNGGCELTCDLKTLTLYDVIKVIDSDRYISECVKPGDECPWREGNDDFCSVHVQLCKIQAVLDRELKKHTIYSILRSKNK